MAELTLFCFFMVFYAYFGYPLLLLAFNLLRTGRTIAGSPPPAPEAYPPLTVIITVRNEEKVLRAKLEETLQLNYGADKVEALLQQPASSVQLIVASDASDDATDDIVREFASRGVELVRLRERGGKERAQREAVSHARGELIVFTDAKISLNAEALNFFAAYFTSPEVGAVSSIDRVESAP
ncbi:MAG TPA: glycosyltransferase, partial [Oligoflexia bacterium]|nr:glycosyltransferase [Oligoflexia bacterium]